MQTFLKTDTVPTKILTDGAQHVPAQPMTQPVKLVIVKSIITIVIVTMIANTLWYESQSNSSKITFNHILNIEEF